MMIDRPNLSGIAVGAMLMLCSIYLMELSKKKKKCKGEEDEVAVGSVNNSNGKGKSKKQLYQGKKTVCAFLGSSVGTRNDYVEAARALGKVLADSNLVLVYGGGNIGLMGELARAHDKAGGTLHGVIPRNLFEIELVSDNTVQLENQEVTGSMHERKQRMAELADCFICLPGGFGTMEEMLEAITWTKLGIHKKPVGLLNVNGFWTNMHEMFSHAVTEGFVGADELNGIVCIDEDPETLVQKLLSSDTYDSDIWSRANSKRSDE